MLYLHHPLNRCGTDGVRDQERVPFVIEAHYACTITLPPARRAPRAPWSQDRGGDRACRGDASLAPVEDLESGMAPAQLVDKLAPVHAAGHDHVGEQKIGRVNDGF
jgi:hypothetical protein